MSPEPKFTDQQMALILKRASELQTAGDEGAHSLESIQQIAQQVGIDPKLVAEVAAHLDDTPQGRALFGAPSAYRTSRRIAGSGPMDHAAIVSTIRDCMPVAGGSREVGDGIEWHAGGSDAKTIVAVSRSGGGTLVRVDVREHGLKGLAYLAGGLVSTVATLVGVGLAHTAGAAVGATVGVAAVGASLIGARAIWNRHVANRQRRIDRLVDRLTEQLQIPPSLRDDDSAARDSSPRLPGN